MTTIKPVSPQHAEKIDRALGLKAISIRLPRDVIAIYKRAARALGVPYQSMMRASIVNANLAQPGAIDSIEAACRPALDAQAEPSEGHSTSVQPSNGKEVLPSGDAR